MNTAQRAAWYRVVAALAIFINLALLTALLWPKQPAPVIEPRAPAVKQADGSVVLERKPDPEVKPKQQIPKGGKIERVVSVTVEPSGTGIKLPSGEVKCPPVTVDLSLVRMSDQTRRVVASSPDGEVVAGLDVPAETLPLPEVRKWAVGLSYDPVRQTPGAWIERDVWRVRVGLDVNQTRQRIGGPIGSEARLRVGFTF